MSPEEQLRIYEEDINAEANIRNAITEAYNDLQPESELVHTYENAQFPGFYSTLSGYGTGAADISPTAALASAWEDVGRKSTSANVARDVFDTRKAGMEDLITRGLGQWQQGYTGAQNAYQRWWAQKQHEDQMALARAQLAGSNANNTVNNVDPLAIYDEIAREANRLYWEDKNKQWNAGADAARNAQVNPVSVQNRLSGYATPAPAVPNTQSSVFNRLVSNFRGQ